MHKSEKAEIAFIEVFRQIQLEGSRGIYALDLISEAQAVAVEASLPHKIGDSLLKIVGMKPRPYRPNYLIQLYPTLAKLEQTGIIESEWDSESDTPDEKRRRLYRLSSNMAEIQREQ